MVPPTIVAEIGCNHRGEFGTAQRMVEIIAGYCREHFHLGPAPEGTPRVVAKFQKRTPPDYPDDYTRQHPNPAHAYGSTYGAHREALELNGRQHAALAELCHLCGIGYACSVWDEQALHDILPVNPAWIKVPSARNRDWPLLDAITEQWAGEIHVSCGMATGAEIRQLVEELDRRGAASRTVLYACTSAYPVAFEDVRLGEVTVLRSEFRGQVKSVGFSGHHAGIAADMGAVALGASHIERHFTLNRTWKGTDHAASLEPDGLRRLIRDAGVVATAMGTKHGEVLDVEWPAREKLTRVAVPS